MTLPLAPPRIDFRASAEQLPCGQCLWLEWKVAGSSAAASGVQLASAGENGLEVIESIPSQGTRQLIFARAGLFTFTLTATFPDGLRHCKQLRVNVQG